VICPACLRVVRQAAGLIDSAGKGSWIDAQHDRLGSMTDVVMAFTRVRWGRHVFAIKGDGGNRPTIQRANTNGTPLFIAGVDSVKARILPTDRRQGCHVAFQNVGGCLVRAIR